MEQRYCTITPSRGDRPDLFRFCLIQLQKMNGGEHLTNAYLMNERPTSEAMDLVPRIRKGVEMAKRDGFEWCFIVEDDDAYPEDYFERFLPYLDGYDFIGDDKSIYYNIKTLRYSVMSHPYRSSLFTTAFRISALNNFEWPDAATPFLDIKLWAYAKHKRKIFIDSGAVGIKHGLGLCGGKGHQMSLKNEDPQMKFLKSKLSDYHIDFYKKFHKSLTVTV